MSRRAADQGSYMNRGNKYVPLHGLLNTTTQGETTLSFAEIESVLGFSATDSATAYAAWWANQMPPSSQSSAWTAAGWRAYPNLRAAHVTFRRNTELVEITDINPLIGVNPTFMSSAAK